jgi:hypothetical protein
MKKILILAVVSLILTTNVMAQEFGSKAELDAWQAKVDADKPKPGYQVNGQEVTKGQWVSSMNESQRTEMEKLGKIYREGKQMTDEAGRICYETPDGKRHLFNNGQRVEDYAYQQDQQYQSAIKKGLDTFQPIMYQDSYSHTEITTREEEQAEVADGVQTFNEHKEALKKLREMREKKEGGEVK